MSSTAESTVLSAKAIKVVIPEYMESMAGA